MLLFNQSICYTQPTAPRLQLVGQCAREESEGGHGFWFRVGFVASIDLLVSGFVLPVFISVTLPRTYTHTHTRRSVQWLCDMFGGLSCVCFLRVLDNPIARRLGAVNVKTRGSYCTIFVVISAF